MEQDAARRQKASERPHIKVRRGASVDKAAHTAHARLIIDTPSRGTGVRRADAQTPWEPAREGGTCSNRRNAKIAASVASTPSINPRALCAPSLCTAWTQARAVAISRWDEARADGRCGPTVAVTFAGLPALVKTENGGGLETRDADHS